MSLDKTLSVIHKTDSFFYVISDSDRIFLNPDDVLRFDMNDLSWINEFKQIRFSKISISILSNNFTLLPSNINTNRADSDISSILNMPTNNSLDQDLVYSQDIKLHFSYDKNADWLNEIKKCTDNLQIQHYFSPIIQNLTYNFKSDGVFAFVEKNELGIIVMRNGQPQLVNLYRINEVEEYLYFILLAYQQTGMTPEQDKLYVAGKVMVESQLYRYLCKYVRYVDFLHEEDNPFGDSYHHYDILSLMKYG